LRRALLLPAAICAPASRRRRRKLSILRACGESDTAAQCERDRRSRADPPVPGGRTRDGGVLRLKARSGAPIELRDQGVPAPDEDRMPGSLRFWDYWCIAKAAIVSVSAHAGDYYLVVDLDRGPRRGFGRADAVARRRRFVVVDLCETQCGNAIELWRFDRDRIVRERTFRPPRSGTRPTSDGRTPRCWRSSTASRRRAGGRRRHAGWSARPPAAHDHRPRVDRR
jgi:hypothetical protein